MQQERDISFDAFRGTAMIAVIALHACGIGFQEIRASAYDFYFLLFYLQVFLFSVPALIFMSGYWSSKRPINSINDYRIFLSKKLPRILIPYLFWSILILGYTSIITHNFDVYKIISKLLLGGASYPYYFVIVLVQLYIITPLLLYINSKKYGLAAVIMLSLVNIFALYLSRIYNVIFHLPMYLPFYSWVIYYQLGLFVGTYGNKSITNIKRQSLIFPAIILCLVISIIEADFLVSKHNNLTFAESPVKFASFLYSICIIIAFLVIRGSNKKWPKFLITAGNYSFGIYLIHMPILHNVAGLMNRLGTLHCFQPLYQIIIVVLTLFICLGVIWAARKLLPKSFCFKVLGF